MISSSHWEAKAKQYQALWRSVLRQGSMCADHIKGQCNVEIKWVEGSDVGAVEFKNLHSDEAEQSLCAAARAAVFHARITGRAVVTITVESIATRET